MHHLHILHIDTANGWRGGQQQLWWLIEGLQRLGIAQTLLVPPRSELARRAEALRGASVTSDGTALEILPLRESHGRVLNLDNARLVKNAATALGASTASLIHAHDAHGHTLAWAARKLSRQPLPPLIVARRVTFPIRWMGRVKNRQPAWFIAVSEFVRRQLIASGIAPERTFVVHDGVQVPAATPSPAERAAARRRMGIAPNEGVADGECVLGTLSSLAPEKMLDDTLRLFAALPKNFRFLLGVPESQATSEPAALLRNLAAALGCGPRFQIVPVQSNAAVLLAGMDLFLYFSRAEGLGSAILLAMAHGLPVVASRTGGIPEIVAENETGVLIDTTAKGWTPGALGAARQAIIELHSDPDTRNRYGTQARAFVVQHASSDNMVARTVAIYHEILAAQAAESRLART